MKIYIDEGLCMGCGLCRVYCQVEHSASKDIIRAFKGETPQPLPRIRIERNGQHCFSIQCRHCDEPVCVYSCLTGAMSRDPASGLITVDEGKCMGCWTCLLVCPYGTLARDEDRHIISKCDLCHGSDVPACVANCPNEALKLSSVEVAL